MKTQLKKDFIEYITDKHFIGLDYSESNTYYKNKSVLDSFLKVCNKLNIIDELETVIDKQLNPMIIVYTALCELWENEPLPEMIDDSFHVSKQSECLAQNTLNGYVNIDINSNNLINDFLTTTALKNTALAEDIKRKLKEDIKPPTNDEDLERKISAYKANVYSLKHADKKYPIYYGWFFESMIYNIIYDFTHENNQITYTPNCSTEFKQYITALTEHEEKLTKSLIDENNINEFVEIAHKDIDNIVINDVENMTLAEKYVCLGLHDVINEQKDISKETLLETYKFLHELTNIVEDQIIGLSTNIEMIKKYVSYILIPQIDHLLNTYIKTLYGGQVIDIIRKPSFNYGMFKGEGDYILVVERNNERFYILTDAKCYTKIQKEEILKFTYQLIGYRQLHRHKLLIPSYRKLNDFNIDAFMILNPLNEINRTMCFNCITLNKYSKELEEFENSYEDFLNKTILE